MKSVLSTVVLVTTIISVSSGFNNKCVRESDGATFKYPESEQLYFVCFNGEMVEVNCRDNYYYNEQIGKCVFTIDVPGEDPTTFNACANIEGLAVIPNVTNCQHFHFCMYGIQLDAVCPANQLFDPILLGCYDAEVVNCYPWATTTLTETTFTTETTTTLTEEETPSDACIGITDGTLVNDPRYCDAFFLCFGENAIEGTCPPPSLFNYNLGMCDLPENFNCDTETTTNLIETTTKPADICYGLPDFTFLNDPRKCADHFICFNGQSIPRSCPDGFYFDPSISICARFETVDCDDNESTTEDTTITTQGTSTTEPTTTAESSTNVETSTTELSTTTSKEPTTTTEESTTPVATTTTEEPTTVQPIPENCPTTGVHAFPNPQRCSNFRFCASGIEFQFACPAGQHFVFAAEKCMPRETANCTIPIPVCDPIASAQTLLILHHPHYCNRFFHCFIGLLTPLECAEGEHFDIASQQCGSPAIANCEA